MTKRVHKNELLKCHCPYCKKGGTRDNPIGINIRKVWPLSTWYFCDSCLRVFKLYFWYEDSVYFVAYLDVKTDEEIERDWLAV